MLCVGVGEGANVRAMVGACVGEGVCVGEGGGVGSDVGEGVNGSGGLGVGSEVCARVGIEVGAKDGQSGAFGCLRLRHEQGAEQVEHSMRTSTRSLSKKKPTGFTHPLAIK